MLTGSREAACIFNMGIIGVPSYIRGVSYQLSVEVSVISYQLRNVVAWGFDRVFLCISPLLQNQTARNIDRLSLLKHGRFRFGSF